MRQRSRARVESSLVAFEFFPDHFGTVQRLAILLVNARPNRRRGIDLRGRPEVVVPIWATLWLRKVRVSARGDEVFVTGANWKDTP